jgi:hypothetical protein
MDLITAAAAAAELNVSSTDARLVRIVAAVQADFRRATGGRSFKAAERTVYVRGFGPAVDFVYLPEAPITAVAEVRIDACGELAVDTAILDLTQFWFERDDCDFRLHYRGSYFPEGPRTVMVRFTGGYADAAALPGDLVDGLLEEVFARYRRGADEQFQSVSVPGAESFTRAKIGTTSQFGRIATRYGRPA